VSPENLKEGEIYFSVIFFDDDMLIPMMEPRVFVNKRKADEKENLYFQDIQSYRRGVRFDFPEAEEEATFETGAGRFMFEYDRALDVLMSYALRRRDFNRK
jgi:hypothetical protein